MVTELQRFQLWQDTRDSGPVRTYYGTVPALAANTDGEIVLGILPDAGVVTSVAYVPAADITGADTNSRTLTLFNRGSDGTGTTVVAQLALTNGVNADGFESNTITLSGTASNLDVAAGETLSFQSDSIGTGIAEPGGLVIVHVDRV